jgi:hypothetical protein
LKNAVIILPETQYIPTGVVQWRNGGRIKNGGWPVFRPSAILLLRKKNNQLNEISQPFS